VRVYMSGTYVYILYIFPFYVLFCKCMYLINLDHLSKKMNDERL